MKKKPFPRIEPRLDASSAPTASAYKPPPVRLSPLTAALIQSLEPAREPGTQPPKVLQAEKRQPLLSRTWRGVTVNRFTDGVEICFADGRKLAARSVWQLLRAMVQDQFQKRKA